MWARIGRRSSSLPVLPGQRPHGAMDRVTGRFAATALIERLSPAGIVTSIVAVELVGQLAERLFQHLVPLPRLRQLGPQLIAFCGQPLGTINPVLAGQIISRKTWWQCRSQLGG